MLPSNSWHLLLTFCYYSKSQHNWLASVGMIVCNTLTVGLHRKINTVWISSGKPCKPVLPHRRKDKLVISFSKESWWWWRWRGSSFLCWRWQYMTGCTQDVISVHNVCVFFTNYSWSVCTCTKTQLDCDGNVVNVFPSCIFQASHACIKEIQN